MRSKHLIFMVFASLLAMSQLSSAGTDTTKVYKIRWVLAHEPIRVFERAARHFSDEVSRETKGRVVVEIINSKTINGGKVYSPEEVYQKLKNGELEMSQTYTTYLGNHSAPFWALDLPFLFRDHEHAAHVLNGKIGKKIMSGLLADNIEGLGFTYSGGYMIIPTAHQEIRSVEDFKGLKISVNNESPVGTALMKTLGAEPMPLSKDSPKLDGFETTYARFVEMDQKTQDSKKVINDLQHSLFLTTILINKEFMASLPPEYQQAVRHAAGTAAVLERKDSIQDGVDLQKKFAAEGYHVVKMTAAEQRKFKESTQPVYTKFEPMLGKDLIKSIRED